MKTDEEIERERAALEPLIGPTRAGWYAEACRFEYDADPDVLLWACRYREMAMEAGRLEQRLQQSQEKETALPCPKCGGSGGGDDPAIRCRLCGGAGHMTYRERSSDDGR
jgi:hypothetical protein